MIRRSNSLSTAGGRRQIYFSPSPLLPRPIPSPLTRRRSHHQPASATPRPPGRPVQLPQRQRPRDPIVQTRISWSVANHAPSSLVPGSPFPNGFPRSVAPPPSSPRGGRRDSAKRVIASPTCSNTAAQTSPGEDWVKRKRRDRSASMEPWRKAFYASLRSRLQTHWKGRDSAGSPMRVGSPLRWGFWPSGQKKCPPPVRVPISTAPRRHMAGEGLGGFEPLVGRVGGNLARFGSAALEDSFPCSGGLVEAWMLSWMRWEAREIEVGQGSYGDNL